MDSVIKPNQLSGRVNRGSINLEFNRDLFYASFLHFEVKILLTSESRGRSEKLVESRQQQIKEVRESHDMSTKNLPMHALGHRSFSWHNGENRI
ncbi:hypothetical protein DKX38_024935 [Salix brachista]|uniref:Uncharacterized protein n=1 Tax=Salix brachista TaxID=2182728 RepID=A0A5N5JPI7_9ROSI|nr:hypothetical protein DKX38_024935 [Salix brachista]